MIEFGHPQVLYGFALALILLPALAWWNDRRSRRLLRQFAADPMIRRLSASWCRRRARAKAVLSVLACLFLILALARPQWGAVTEEIEIKGVDVLFALDTSRSMLAEDYPPNRLERSKLAITDLVGRLKGDRVGLIAFAGQAFLQTPLTLDYPAFLQTLREIDTGTIPRGGTDVAGAIEEAMTYLGETENHRVLILISDGEDLAASGIERAGEAAETGLSIFTVGVGSVEGELIPLRDPDGRIDYVRQPNGDPVRTRLDETSLRAIAEAGRGAYQRLGNGLDGLHEIYAAARARLDETDLGRLTRETPIERYPWFLLPALFCLALEWGLGTRKRPAASQLAFACFALPFAFSLLAPPSAHASPRQAERAYRDRDYEQAVALWTDAIAADEANPKLHYNLGNAQYRLRDFAAAIDAYERALPLADTALQERIFHNLGTAQARLGSEALAADPDRANRLWNEALRNYANCLALNPEAADAARSRTWIEEQFALKGARIRIAASPPAGGTTSSGGRFLRGVNVPLKATPNPGWRFAGWEGAEIDDPEAAETFLEVREEAEVVARFVETRRLTVLSADPERGTAGESGRFDLGQEVPIEAEAKDYFAFDRWESEQLEIADPTAASTTVKLADDGTVAAVFTEAFRLDIAVEPAIGGTAGESGFFAKHSEVPIHARARDGFRWLGWSGPVIADIADIHAPRTRITLNADRTILAQFERVWDLVVLPNTDQGGSATGGGNFEPGTLQPIEATPNQGFAFDRWEGDGVTDPNSAATTVRIRGGTQDVVAIFRGEQDQGDDGENNDQQTSDPNSPSENSEDNPSDDDSQNADETEDARENSGESDDPSASGAEDAPDPADNESSGRSDEAEPGESEPADPLRLSREEAEQLLQILRQDARRLPLRMDDPADRDSSDHRNW